MNMSTIADNRIQRLDVALVQRGLLSSRHRAKDCIMRGFVTVNGSVVTKPAAHVFTSDALVVKEEGSHYVSRAAFKLKHAIQHWDIDVNGAQCLDVGSSTGGFTQVLLEEGAVHVWAVDVGTDQLHESIAGDDRVTVHEQTDIRAISMEDLQEPFDIIVIDVSFISLSEVLAHCTTLLRPGGRIVALIKPQFEVGKDKNKKGVVTDETLHAEAVAKAVRILEELGYVVQAPVRSPITGGSGNIEYLTTGVLTQSPYNRCD